MLKNCKYYELTNGLVAVNIPPYTDGIFPWTSFIKTGSSLFTFNFFEVNGNITC